MHSMVMNAWQQVFPHSRIHMRKILGSIVFNCFLAEDAHECVNGIMENDPLSYVAKIENETYVELAAFLMIAPEPGSHLAFGRAKMRRKTIKDFDRAKLVARFEQLRDFIRANKDKATIQPFDIESKI